MSGAVNLGGMRFGRLVAIRRAKNRPVRISVWLCRCDCGSEKEVPQTNLRLKKTRSCGCLQVELSRERKTTHGMRYTPEYRAWRHMISRCGHGPAHKDYKYYGARGIKVFDEWRRSFASFYASIGPRPSPDLSLDRINNSGNYEPGNCRWATSSEQNRNKRKRGTVL